MSIFKSKIKVDEKLTHIAFIMDGNGRWAKKRGLPRKAGHRAGANAFREIVEYCGKIGIKVVTVYAFSTENWKRPADEVNALMDLLNEYMNELIGRIEKLEARICFIGDRSKFKSETIEKMNFIEESTKKHDRRINIALNYGGRDEIVRAVNTLIREGKRQITEEDINSRLYTHDCPPPDLIVRGANEKRLSNFLIWQSAYSEFYFCKTLWPDMKPSDVDKAVRDFYKRERRFGAVKS